jgi:kojibiose phosphorylase
LEFRAATEGHVDTAGWVHWEWVGQGSSSPQVDYLQVRTKSTGIELCEASYLAVEADESPAYAFWDSQWSPTLVSTSAIKPGGTLRVVKIVSIFTTRETENPKRAALEKIDEAIREGYKTLRTAHQVAWKREWDLCDVIIEGYDEADRALRYSLFQLLIAAPRNESRVSIAAKTLSGIGYRGHVFWDTEIFILPFFIYTRPEIARNLLFYRYHTLPGARRKAMAAGYEGAMYAWESAATGDETTPHWIPGPDGSDLIRIWCGDIEHHISADVAFGVYQYWQITGDNDFMRDYGAEIILDTARFWGTRAEWNPQKDRYEITDVIGPDEYHEHVDNNAYTNNLARWNLRFALEVLQWLLTSFPEKAAELTESLDLTPGRLEYWKEVIDKIYTSYDPKTGLYEQFEGYFDRRFVAQKEFEPRTKSLQALLGIEGVQAYQFLKQPDALMYLYLLQDQINWETIKKNWDFYTPRTDLSYGSSLGPAIQAALAARAKVGDIDEAYQHFIHAARTDLENIRGNTPEGIHAATAGGLWQAVVLGFGGLRITENSPSAEPNLPAHWKRLNFRIQYHGQPFEFDLRPDSKTTVSNQQKPEFPILGAIFDLDGVLTDTSENHYQAWQRLADEEGLPFNRQENEALRGVPRRESLMLLLKGCALLEEKLQEMMERKNLYYQESITRLTPGDLLPVARELLLNLRQQGVKIAIGSASKNARTVVEKLGIGEQVDAIADGYSVERQKPSPDLFLHAAALLGLPPQKCVVFEDAEAGVEAALSGGMWAIGIGPPERVGGAHLVLTNLEELTWQLLLERLQDRWPNLAVGIPPAVKPPE